MLVVTEEICPLVNTELQIPYLQVRITVNFKIFCSAPKAQTSWQSSWVEVS